jgi:hypothetical protein
VDQGGIISPIYVTFCHYSLSPVSSRARYYIVWLDRMDMTECSAAIATVCLEGVAYSEPRSSDKRSVGASSAAFGSHSR